MGSLENPIFRGEGRGGEWLTQKNNIQGEFVRKVGLRQFADLRERDLTKKRAMHFI